MRHAQKMKTQNERRKKQKIALAAEKVDGGQAFVADEPVFMVGADGKPRQGVVTFKDVNARVPLERLVSETEDGLKMDVLFRPKLTTHAPPTEGSEQLQAAKDFLTRGSTSGTTTVRRRRATRSKWRRRGASTSRGRSTAPPPRSWIR